MLVVTAPSGERERRSAAASDADEALLQEVVDALRELAATDPRGFVLAIAQATETTELLLRQRARTERRSVRG